MNKEHIDLLNKEKNKVRIDNDFDVFETYSNLMFDNFFDYQDKFNEVPNIDKTQAVLYGMNLIDDLFWIIYNNSFNLQLTSLLVERGKLLYTEFISMSRSQMIMKQIDKYPSISDAFLFAVKRSIGSISISKNNAHFNTDMNKKRTFYKKFFNIIENKIESNLTHNLFIDEIQSSIVKNIDLNIELYSTFIQFDEVNNLNLYGFLFFMKLLSTIYYPVNNEKIDSIVLFLNANKNYINSISINELYNKAHFLIIEWDNNILF